jgi:dTDP-4-amino-4,6-dideoxygalactose transaminase
MRSATHLQTVEPAPPAGEPAAPERRFIPSLAAMPARLLAPQIARTRRSLYPFDRLDQPATELFYLARAGVFHAVSRLLGERRGTVLMPAYHHGVEVQAVRAAGAGVAFYRVDADMQVDLDDLSRRMRAPDVRLIYLTHFVGFPQPVTEVARLCADAGLPLLEDCALALLSRDPEGRPLGSTGDAAVFCLYKTLPVPHGGVLVSRDTPTRAELRRPPLLSTLHHAAGLMLSDLEMRASHLGRAIRFGARKLAHSTVDVVVSTVKTGTQDLHPDELTLAASRLVRRIVGRIDMAEVVMRRRRNFQRLADALTDHVPVIGAPLAPGTCPLFVPVRVQDKGAALQALRARGIDAIDFWCAPDPGCDSDEFRDAAALRRDVLELPCHQSLDDDALDFVARSALEVIPRA